MPVDLNPAVDAFVARVTRLGFDSCAMLDPRSLETDAVARSACEDNLCGEFGANHMCPPLVDGLRDERPLSTFAHGLLVQVSYPVSGPPDMASARDSRLDFHGRILQLEQRALTTGSWPQVWGLVGGSCAWCERCTALDGEPCVHPEAARPSIEALGYQVMSMIEAAGWDAGFHDDRINWTGLLLLGD